MLFLLNDNIVDIPSPDMHLLENWRTMGCGDPRKLRASDAIGFATESVAEAGIMTPEMACNIAALVIVKTGANCLILKRMSSGAFEPRLRNLPILVLETYARGAANDSKDADQLRTA